MPVPSLRAGKSLVAVRNWTFVLGPGFIVGIGNGLILGYLMYQSRLVPRGMAILGLIGGPLICLSGIAVVMGIIERGSAAQSIATVPEFLWELSLGIYLPSKASSRPRSRLTTPAGSQSMTVPGRRYQGPRSRRSPPGKSRQTATKRQGLTASRVGPTAARATRSLCAAAARLAAPRIAALAHRDDGDADRYERIRPPPAERRIDQQANQQSRRQICAQQGLTAPLVVADEPSRCPTRRLAAANGGMVASVATARPIPTQLASG